MFKYLEALIQHWQRFAFLCLVVPAIAGAGALYLFQGQDGTAQLWVDNPSYIGNIQTASGWNQYLTPAQNTVDSLGQLILTDTFYQELGQSFVNSGAVHGTSQRDQAVADVKNSISVTASGSHLVTIKVECRTHNLCIQALNTTIDLHRQWLIDIEKQQSDIASQFYTAQLKLAQDRQTTATNAFNSYVASHPLTPNVVRAPDPEYDRLQSDLNQAQAAVSDLQDKLQSVQFTNDAASEIDQTALRVIDPATTSGGRFTSVTKKMVVVFAAVAALPGFAYLIFLGWIDRTTRSPKEIESRIGIRVISTVGNVPALVGNIPALRS